jgi:hypothetical protein
VYIDTGTVLIKLACGLVSSTLEMTGRRSVANLKRIPISLLRSGR